MIKIDGASISQRLRSELKEDIESTKSRYHKYIDNYSPNYDLPHLVAILVGEDPASTVYITQKEKACLEVGIKFTLITLDHYTTTTTEIITRIKDINMDPSIHGCIVQLPLPSSIDDELVINAISPEKDVDCFHPNNIGLLSLNKAQYLPATPYGIQMLLENMKIPTRGKHVVIIGKSLIVGQPLMTLLSLEKGVGATVTCCDKNTENLSTHTKTADILIVAAGVHHLINDPFMIKEGATIIDVGIHRITDVTRKTGYRLEGDVNYDLLQDRAGYMTPVPGGVGPMTVVALLYNTFKSYKYHLTSEIYNERS